MREASFSRVMLTGSLYPLFDSTAAAADPSSFFVVVVVFVVDLHRHRQREMGHSRVAIQRFIMSFSLSFSISGFAFALCITIDWLAPPNFYASHENIYPLQAGSSLSCCAFSRAALRCTELQKTFSETIRSCYSQRVAALSSKKIKRRLFFFPSWREKYTQRCSEQTWWIVFITEKGLSICSLFFLFPSLTVGRVCVCLKMGTWYWLGPSILCCWSFSSFPSTTTRVVCHWTT